MYVIYNYVHACIGVYVWVIHNLCVCACVCERKRERERQREREREREKRERVCAYAPLPTQGAHGSLREGRPGRVFVT